MYVVLDSKCGQVFKGYLSDATEYILTHYGPLDSAIRTGVRMIPCFWSPSPKGELS